MTQRHISSTLVRSTPIALLTLLVQMWLVQLASGDETPFYLSLETPPAPELSTEQALASFSIAPEFQIELVASEPLVEDPVAIAWDETGDLYVVEMRGFMPDAYGNNDTDPVGMVIRLRDLDNDGAFDQRQVLLDRLVLPRAIAIVNEGLLIGEPPNLWLCPSKSGLSKDIDCQQKTRLSQYGDQPGNVEHAENGLLLAIDNWIYNAKSNRRMRIKNGVLVIEPTLFRGQWGITQDIQGLLYYNTNSNFLLGDLYDSQPVIAAGNSGGPGLNIRVSKDDQVFAVRVNTGVNRAYVPGVLRPDGRLDKPTSASGMVGYRGDQFPEDYRRDVFVAEPAANAVVQLRFKNGDLKAGADHILYEDEKWGRREFLASTDERFRPVDVDVGPDGALYIVDMYRGIIQDQLFLSDELRAQALSRGLDKPVGRGRIWRVTAKNEARRTGRPNSVASGKKLVKLLSHENGWYRDTAQRLLLDDAGSGIDVELTLLVAKDSELSALHAIWTLTGRGSLNHRTVKKALVSQHRSVRVAALRAGHQLLAATELLDMAKQSASVSVAHHATMYLAAHNKIESVLLHLAETVVQNREDAMTRTAVQAAASGNELALIEAMLEKNWREQDERSTGFIKNLVSQNFKMNPGNGESLLDRVMRQDHQWLQEVMLAGMSEVARDDSFGRVVLGKPHILFTDPPQNIWPAIANARAAFTWAGDDLAANAKPLSPDQQRRKNMGEAYFLSRCAICHGADGEGIASLAPVLAGSEWVTGPSERLARIVLQGLRGPISVRGETWNSMMPGHQDAPAFDDVTASGLLTFLHRAWGHAGPVVDPEFIAQVRVDTGEHPGMWTIEELANIDINTHYRQYAGTYGTGLTTFKFSYNGRDLMVESVYLKGPMREEKEDHFFFEARDFRIEFLWGDDRTIKSVRLANAGGPVLPRVPQ